MSAAFDIVEHLSRHPALPPIDPRTVAPGDWQYLGDLVPVIELHEELRQARISRMYPEIARAARAVAWRYKLGRNDAADDLRQEVALRLLSEDAFVSKPYSWACTAATRIVCSQLSVEANQRRILRDANRSGAPLGYRKRSKAVYAPRGELSSRYLPVPPFQPDPRRGEDEMVEDMDRRRAEQAIRDKLTLSHQSTLETTNSTEALKFTRPLY